MAKNIIRLGFIGLSSKESWAARAHVPAIKAAGGFSIAALSTSNMESARSAAHHYAVPVFFDDPVKLAEHPGVEVVVVAVKVPHHRELVSAALNAGKPVYCEWPLGNGLSDAVEMEAHAGRSGVRGFVGLQGRSSPALRFIRDFVADGAIGEVISTTLVASAGAWADTIDPRLVYGLDRKNGVSMLTVQFGHTVDGLCWCLGEFSEVSATLATRFPKVKRTDTGEIVDKTIADQIAVHGILKGGAVASIHYRSGSSPVSNFVWEINGSDGDLVVTSDNGRLQYSDLHIRHASRKGGELHAVEIPEAYRPIAECKPSDMFYTLANAYRLMHNDLVEGTSNVPQFSDAVLRHRLIDAIEEASRTGQRRAYA